MPFKSLTKQSLSKLFLKGCQEDLKKFICEIEINFDEEITESITLQSRNKGPYKVDKIQHLFVWKISR